MFSKLLVPLDGSTLAEKALPYAVSLARRMESELVLLQVLEMPPVIEGSLAAENALISSAESYLEKVKEIITDSDRVQHIPAEQVHSKVAFGNPQYEVAEIAATSGANLIVMTTHGRSGVAQLIMGSVASGVIQHTDLPVLVIRPVNDKSTKNQTLAELMSTPLNFGLQEGWGRILVTLDGTPQSELVIDSVVELAQKIDASIHLVQVIPPLLPFSYGDISYRYREDIEQEKKRIDQVAWQHLKKVEDEIRNQGLECSYTLHNGYVADEILHTIADLKVSIVAMATRARGRLGQVLLGSVAEEVVRRSHLPVLLLRATGGNRPQDS